MHNRRYPFVALALVTLVASALACKLPTPTSESPTMTPYVPATASPQEPPSATPTSVPEATATDTPLPAATDTPPPAATDTPLPTPTPTPIPASTLVPPTPVPTATPEPTATPTSEATVAPLDFQPPQYVDSWEKKGSTYKVALRVDIVGGVPPFTVSHGPTVQGTTMDRVFLIEFEWSSCKSAMVQSITVESSDGQKVHKDYFIPVANMPWCTTPSP
jgi:hypothetical protein